jgi:hypothetical protein
MLKIYKRINCSEKIYPNFVAAAFLPAPSSVGIGAGRQVLPTKFYSFALLMKWGHYRILISLKISS